MGAGGNTSIDQSDNAPSPLFSRSSADISRKVGGTIKGLVASVMHKGVDYRGLGLQFMGCEKVTERYGHLFAQGTPYNLMAQYNKLAVRMDAEVAESGHRSVIWPPAGPS